MSTKITDIDPNPTQPRAGIPAEAFLSRRELAERWRCCVHTVARRQDLEAVRLGRRLLRYRLKDVEAIEAAAGK